MILYKFVTVDICVHMAVKDHPIIIKMRLKKAKIQTTVHKIYKTLR